MKKIVLISTLSFITGALFFALAFGFVQSDQDSIVSQDIAHARSDYSDPQAVQGDEEFKGISFAPIVKKVKPAVVKIDAVALINGSSGFESLFDDDILRRFFGERRRNQTRKVPKSGSGFLISKDGYIITNNHLVSDAIKVTVILLNKKEYKAEIVGTDPLTDVALLKIKGKSFPYIKLGDSEKIQVGDFVLAIGNPLRQNLSVTSGIISAKNRRLEGIGIQVQKFIQTDAAINQGNSGGPLVNTRGEAIGINSVILSQTGGSIGLGFAIPSNMAKDVINDLKNKGKVTRGYLGIQLDFIDQNQAKEWFDLTYSGILVKSVEENTPAANAGLKRFDFITQINGRSIDENNFINIIARSAPGTKINLVVYRKSGLKNKMINLNITLSEYPDNSSNTNLSDKKKYYDLGMELKNNSTGFAQRYSLSTSKGIVVMNVTRGSNAWENNLRRGDILLSINRTDIKDVNHFLKIVSNKEPSSKLMLIINRQGRDFILPYSLPD